MSRVLSLRSRRGPYHRHKVPSFTVPVYGHGACLCSRAMFERVQCVKTRILRRSEVVTCIYYTGDGSRTTIADVRPLDRTSSSWPRACVGGSKHNVFGNTLTLRPYCGSRRLPATIPTVPPAGPVLATSRTSHWPPALIDSGHFEWLKVLPLARDA